MKTIGDFEVSNKKVLVRCDFSIPLTDQGNILDDFRIQKTIPTITYLTERKARIILMSHLGRPEAKEGKYSLKKVAVRLGELLKKGVRFLPEVSGSRVKKEIEKMQPGEIVLLENLRFDKREQENNKDFAKELSQLGDFFINDAFGVCHRAHASVVGIPQFLPSGAGLLLEKEIKVLSSILEKPKRPLVVLIGGVKFENKMKVIENLFTKADHVLLGGEIANVILKGRGISIGVLPEPEVMEEIKGQDWTSPKIHLPLDGVISLIDIERGLKEGYLRTSGLGTVRKEEKAYDIGPETIELFSQIIKEARTIFWSGPMGMFENTLFEKGTRAIAKAIVSNQPCFKVVGGGDTNSALHKFGLRNKFDHVSTGGGAMLTYLSGEKLPGLEALR